MQVPICGRRLACCSSFVWLRPWLRKPRLCTLRLQWRREDSLLSYYCLGYYCFIQQQQLQLLKRFMVGDDVEGVCRLCTAKLAVFRFGISITQRNQCFYSCASLCYVVIDRMPSPMSQPGGSFLTVGIFLHVHLPMM